MLAYRIPVWAAVAIALGAAATALWLAERWRVWRRSRMRSDRYPLQLRDLGLQPGTRTAFEPPVLLSPELARCLIERQRNVGIQPTATAGVGGAPASGAPRDIFSDIFGSETES